LMLLYKEKDEEGNRIIDLIKHHILRGVNRK